MSAEDHLLPNTPNGLAPGSSDDWERVPTKEKLLDAASRPAALGMAALEGVDPETALKMREASDGGVIAQARDALRRDEQDRYEAIEGVVARKEELIAGSDDLDAVARDRRDNGATDYPGTGRYTLVIDGQEYVVDQDGKIVDE